MIDARRHRRGPKLGKSRDLEGNPTAPRREEALRTTMIVLFTLGPRDLAKNLLNVYSTNASRVTIKIGHCSDKLRKNMKR